MPTDTRQSVEDRITALEALLAEHVKTRGGRPPRPLPEGLLERVRSGEISQAEAARVAGCARNTIIRRLKRNRG